VLGVASDRLLDANTLVSQVPMPASRAAEATLTTLALSTLHAEEHWSVGAVPVEPFWAAKLAPTLPRVSEFAGSVAPAVT
jgi:hypothetical protein